MKTAICYYSRHHGNTRKVLEAMTEGRDVDLIDVTARTEVCLEPYERVGFASGVYHGRFHDAVLNFAREFLPEGRDVFFVYTCGTLQAGYTNGIAGVVREKNVRILGEYGCRGFDTFGPFKLVGGVAKGHPNADELQKAGEFLKELDK